VRGEGVAVALYVIGWVAALPALDAIRKANGHATAVNWHRLACAALWPALAVWAVVLYVADWLGQERPL
jgi:hypothetical protein